MILAGSSITELAQRTSIRVCPSAVRSRSDRAESPHDPYAYLKDMLTQLSSRKANDIGVLLPHRWQPTVIVAWANPSGCVCCALTYCARITRRPPPWNALILSTQNCCHRMDL